MHTIQFGWKYEVFRYCSWIELLLSQQQNGKPMNEIEKNCFLNKRLSDEFLRKICYKSKIVIWIAYSRHLNIERCIKITIQPVHRESFCPWWCWQWSLKPPIHHYNLFELVVNISRLLCGLAPGWNFWMLFTSSEISNLKAFRKLVIFFQISTQWYVNSARIEWNTYFIDIVC